MGNLFLGISIADLLLVGLGPGLRINDEIFHLSMYGSVRLALNEWKVSPHIQLSAGSTTNTGLGADEGYLCAMVQGGAQFKFEKVNLTLFLGYENLPMYRKIRARGSGTFDSQTAHRFEVFFVGLGIGL